MVFGGTGRSSIDMQPAVVFSERGISTFELLLILVFLGLAVATVAPAYLETTRKAQLMECSCRLAVIQEAKKEVFEEMNRILPANKHLRITDRVNPLHLDKIARKTLESPWRFHPEDSFPGCGAVSVGQTFLDPPSSSTGVPIANLHGAAAE